VNTNIVAEGLEIIPPVGKSLERNLGGARPMLAFRGKAGGWAPVHPRRRLNPPVDRGGLRSEGSRRGISPVIPAN